jgi:hypothetical protein
MIATKTGLPKLRQAGRGESWLDIGHYRGDVVFGWSEDEGIVTAPVLRGEAFGWHRDLPAGDRRVKARIVGRIDGRIASMRCDSRFFDAEDVAMFLVDLAAEYHKVRCVVQFVD